MRATRALQGNVQIRLPLPRAETEMLTPARHCELVDALIDLLIHAALQAQEIDHRERGEDECQDHE